MLSSSITYPTCYLNNQELILKPGNKFSTKELKSRLNEMGIKIFDSQPKIELINLYEKALKDDNNKLKIFDKLKKDHESLNINITNKRSVLSDNIDININSNTNKVTNIRNNKSFNPNYYEYQQEIKLYKNNNYNNKRNPFINNEEINHQNDDTYNDNDNENNLNNENLDVTPQYNIINNKNNELNNSNDDIISDNDNDNKSNISKTTSISLFSTFSSFSIINSLKMQYKEILRQILLGFIIICAAFGFLYIYRIFSEPINNFFSLLINLLSNSGSFFLNYWYVIPFILIFVILILFLYKHSKIKKCCKEIIKKIKSDLKKENNNYNNNNRNLSEDDIYRRYVQDLGINKKKFKKSYLPVIKKLVKKDKNLKIFEDNVDGKKMIFVEYQ